MKIRIALAGNPNSGKTTLFNQLTGSSQYVGNWPGVTVEKKAGKVKGHNNVELIDLPGIYSLSPYSLEEVVTRNYLIDEEPDIIINIVDSTNIERNLYLTTQLTEVGIPVITALNMTDVIRKKGDQIDVKKLGEKMGCEVIEISALKGEGCTELIEKALKLAHKKTRHTHRTIYSHSVETTLTKIEEDILKNYTEDITINTRWYAVKLFERDAKVLNRLKLTDADVEKLETLISLCEKESDDDSESIIINERYNYVGDVVKECIKKKNTSNVTLSDKVDRIVTNRFLALPIFAAVMFLVYYVSVSSVGGMLSDKVSNELFGDIIPSAVERLLISTGSAEWLNSLILDGIIGGVGAVLGFLPQMLVLFLFLGILEDCGYMARIAFMMDRIFRKFGLSGKSFIPMLIGTGCGVPGIMASRTIESERDRRMTIITTTFIPCSAKLPVIALIAGALFNNSIWVAPSAYFIGILAVIISGLILKKTVRFAGDTAPFVMELPPYHLPGLKNLLLHVWDRVKSFIKKAGTVIFLASGVIWFLSSFDMSLNIVDASDSILARLGNVFAPLFAPLGWGNWQSTVATITGLVAKENVVSTFGILYGFSDVAENGAELWPLLQQSFTQLSAYSFLVFNLLCAPCSAAVGAIRREMGNAKWTWFAVGYQTGFAYAISLIIYQLGMLFTGNGFGFWTATAVAMLILMTYLIVRPYKPQHKGVLHVKEALDARGGA